jgi:HAD superfamily hydrolase (TIGR01459 family)
MSRPTFVTGLAALAERFAGFIVDQWGVLHDGSSFYPHALDALHRLKSAGSRVVLLSNSGRRLASNRRRLAAMGLDPQLVEAVVTSGEIAWSLLRDRAVEPYRSLPGRCLLWSEGGDRAILEGLAVLAVEEVADAGFILLAGIPSGRELRDLDPDLIRAAERRLPMICCNPDRVVVTATGLVPATGSVAARFEKMGGTVHYVGKPHAPVYERCLALLALPRERILAIGDSLEHDIAGGAAVGLRTAMITSGIHGPAFDPGNGEALNRAALDELARGAPALPDWVLARFEW